MYQDYSVTAVVPAHNEEAHIGDVIRTMPGLVDTIIVVDDSSSDRTSEVTASQQDPRVLILQTPRNLGVGGATVLGYRKALELKSDIVVKMDGDGQMSPDHLPSLLNAVTEGGYDYAKGNRFLHGDALADMPRSRLLGNIALTFLTKLASGYWHIFDPQNGYTAIKAGTLSALDLDRVHPRFFFENDMLVNLNLHGARVKDVAMPARYGAEQSDMKLARICFTFPWLLARRFWHRVYQKYVLRDFSPIALFLFSGLLLFFGGLLYGAVLWAHSVITGRPTPIGTITLGLLPIVIGFQLVLQAIVLDIQESPK